MKNDTNEVMQFYYDDKGYYAYIMLNATLADFNMTCSRLFQNGFNVLHKGESKRPASNNRQYQWFIRVGDQTIKPQPGHVDDFFFKVLGVESETKKIERLKNWHNKLLEDMDEIEEKNNKLEQDKLRLSKESEEYQGIAGDFDKENQMLKRKIQEYEIEIKILNGKLEKQEKESEICEAEKEIDRSESQPQRIDRIKNDILHTINALLPNISFIKKSEDHLINEVEDLTQPLRKLWQLSYDPANLKAPRFKSTKKFKELHFGADGRIYFREQKQANGKTEVLISFKQNQEQDEDYLKKYEKKN
jgi:uncharacterized protein YoxC